MREIEIRANSVSFSSSRHMTVVWGVLAVFSAGPAPRFPVLYVKTYLPQVGSLAQSQYRCL